MNLAKLTDGLCILAGLAANDRWHEAEVSVKETEGLYISGPRESEIDPDVLSRLLRLGFRRNEQYDCWEVAL